MNEYEVMFVYEVVNIRTIAIAYDEEEAETVAEANLVNAGIILENDPYEIVITKTGEYRL